MRSLALLLLAIPGPLWAQAVVATRDLAARTTVGQADVATVTADIPGVARSAEQVVGQELRVAVSAGRPLRLADLTAPAAVERNQPVLLHYRVGRLAIAAEGRALDRAAAGQTVRVMNLASRGILDGVVRPDGSVRVGPEAAP